MRPEDELLLLAIATRERREAAAGRAATLLERVDWDALDALLVRQRLLALVGARLAEWTDPPAAFAERAERAVAAGRRQAHAAKLVGARLLEDLAAAGVRALPLKGPFLAGHLYGDEGLRAFADLDVLVGADDLAPAGEALARIGYRDDGRTRTVSGRPLLHVRYAHPGGLPDVELHWRVHWYETRFAAALLERARPDADGWLRAQAADELAALLLFLARDGLAGVRLVADVAQWWDRRAAELDAGALAAIARDHPALGRALAAAAAQARRLAAVPLDVVDGCDAGCRRALLIGDWTLRRSDVQLRADALLVDVLLAPTGGRRAALRRALLLRPDAASTRGARALARTAEHAARVARRWAVALWRTRRGTAWSPAPGAGRGRPS